VATKKETCHLTNGELVEEKPRQFSYCFARAKSEDKLDGIGLVLMSTDITKPLPVEIGATTETSVTVVVGQHLKKTSLTSADLVLDNE
jgi:hypothetical protein